MSIRRERQKLFLGIEVLRPEANFTGGKAM
jgi:hypothetical protein